MGQGASHEDSLEPSTAAAGPTRFERISLSSHLREIRAQKTTLPALLGIDHFEGAPVLLRMADSLASHDLDHNILTAINWLTGHANAGTEEWRHTLFSAACTVSLGSQALLAYEDLLSLFQLLLSAYDWDPADFSATEIRALDMRAVEDLLRPFRVAAIRFDQFNDICGRYPFVFPLVARIWKRLLVDSSTTIPASAAQASAAQVSATQASATQASATQASQTRQKVLSRVELGVLYAIYGPKVLDTTLLFTGDDGFSMTHFIQKLTECESSEIIVIRGQCSSKLRMELGKVLPPLDTQYAGRIDLGLILPGQWHANHGTYSGSGRVLVWKPYVHLCGPSTVFLKASAGLGFGFTPPSSYAATLRETNVLAMDGSMQYGVLQLDGKSDFRFRIDSVSAIGVTKRL